jgi:hypothetical protein
MWELHIKHVAPPNTSACATAAWQPKATATPIHLIIAFLPFERSAPLPFWTPDAKPVKSVEAIAALNAN